MYTYIRFTVYLYNISAKQLQSSFVAEPRDFQIKQKKKHGTMCSVRFATHTETYDEEGKEIVGAK